MQGEEEEQEQEEEGGGRREEGGGVKETLVSQYSHQNACYLAYMYLGSTALKLLKLECAKYKAQFLYIFSANAYRCEELVIDDKK